VPTAAVSFAHVDARVYPWANERVRIEREQAEESEGEWGERQKE